MPHFAEVHIHLGHERVRFPVRHSEIKPYILAPNELHPQVNEHTTVHHVKVEAERISGHHIEGLSSPHLLAEGRQW